MDMPKYDGVLEQWKVDLIILQAKRQGFRSHELPDLLQEAVLIIRQFVYDPDHAMGATERTVLTTVIDNYLRKKKRTASRYQIHLDQYAPQVSIFSTEEVETCVMDVRSAMTILTRRQQTICHGLMKGLSTNQLASQLGCGWNTINGEIQDIRQQFEALGLKGWIEE